VSKSLSIIIALCVLASLSAKPPNIVFILADDLGYGELGCYGQEKIKTTNLDRLAREGMRFTHHYPGAPVCAPASRPKGRKNKTYNPADQRTKRSPSGCHQNTLCPANHPQFQVFGKSPSSRVALRCPDFPQQETCALAATARETALGVNAENRKPEKLKGMR